jgi:pyruvate/2-oxoglutarate dehydrogenase complex dihydrolipoamide acyltransferase (E2) component
MRAAGGSVTATAQGRRLPCDYAGCLEPGTVEVDAWVYCDQHGGKTPTAPAARPTVVRTSPTITTPGAPLPPAHSPIGLLLEQASGHSVAKVRRLAEKIELQLTDLRGLVAEHEAEEKRRKAEAAAKEKARAEVARLEAELAAAKAKLRGQAAPAIKTTERLCDRCGKPSKAPGQAPHLRRVQGRCGVTGEPWQTRALCAEVDDDLFFPPQGGNSAPAQQVCLGCPVRVECLQFALDHQVAYGVWGGTTASMRDRLLRRSA